MLTIGKNISSDKEKINSVQRIFKRRELFQLLIEWMAFDFTYVPVKMSFLMSSVMSLEAL